MTELCGTRPKLQAMLIWISSSQRSLSLALVFAFSSACCAQMPTPPMVFGQGYEGTLPQFDVISVKPHKAGDSMMRVHWGKSDYSAENVTLKDTIASVNGVKEWLVFGLPSWAESSRWDIAAKVSSPDLAVMEKLTAAQRREMIGGILKERFAVVVHMEQKVQPVYVMTAMPQGSKLKQSPPLPLPAEDAKPKNNGGMLRVGRGTLTATRIKLSNLADNLSYQLERAVIDRTGLDGEYDLDLKWTPEERSNAGDNGLGDAPPAIFEALKEQLGLKLTAAKESVPTVLVDHVEQPRDN